MNFRYPVLLVLALVLLFVLSSVASLRLSFDVPETAGVLMRENCGARNFYEDLKDRAEQNKILINTFHTVITMEPIITYLEKQEKSPPAAGKNIS